MIEIRPDSNSSTTTPDTMTPHDYYFWRFENALGLYFLGLMSHLLEQRLSR